MSNFEDIFADVLRIVTFQPREARMRHRAAEWDERLQVPARKDARDERRTDRLPD